MLSRTLALLCLSAAISPAMARDGNAPSNRLELPAQNIVVDLDTGLVSSKDSEGQCIEKASRSGHHKLVVMKAPGDDYPTVTVNSEPSSYVDTATGRSRLGGIGLSRDGSLAHLRTWKTSGKQTELVQDGDVVESWERGSTVRLLRFTRHAAYVLEESLRHPARLTKYMRDKQGRVGQGNKVLIDFGSCKPDRLLLRNTEAWAKLLCEDTTRNGIYRIPLSTGQIDQRLVEDANADFFTLARNPTIPDGEAIATISGTENALHFYHAVSGLLLAQTGEVRACSSDAEGLQSWNQSYRVRALAELFEKTAANVFADLARKSLRLTLAARDGKMDRASHKNPSCGWSSTIYGLGANHRLSLLVNQSVISNSIRSACDQLGLACPDDLRREIRENESCLAEAFEADFDPQTQLYRITKDVDFRFSGAIAPWNWQISFAALLQAQDNPTLKRRAAAIAEKFIGEWKKDENGALWRYWPNAYYVEKGLRASQIDNMRYEDTGHAGISLLSLSAFGAAMPDTMAKSIRNRLDFMMGFGHATPRDLNGEGPKEGRWFPSGGWSNYASDTFSRIYANSAIDRQSADALFTFARLFDPKKDFQLNIDVQICGETCLPFHRYTFDSWQSFLFENPLFRLTAPNFQVPSGPRNAALVNFSEN